MMFRKSLVLFAACAAVPFVPALLARDEVVVPPVNADPPAKTEPATRPAVKPKPLTANVQKGLDWVANHQLANGAWGQGEESQHMGGGRALQNVASVADTAVATMALLRSGSTPREGPYATHINRAVGFICEQVEKADAKDLFVTDNRQTRVQQKLGPHIDTFLASLVLTEVKDQMPDEASNQRVSAAIQKIVNKLEHNVQQNGQWTREGWAPVLANGLAGKAYNFAAQKGARVDGDRLAMVNSIAVQDVLRYESAPASSRAFAGADGAAGIELYGRSANLGQLQAAEQTARERKSEIQRELSQPTTQPDRAKQLKEEEARLDQQLAASGKARAAVVERMNDEQFVAGFGSNGGEEFLSYMTIGEAMLLEGGETFAKWDQSMTDNLNRVQNDDGSWSGHHCITGKTFCTSTALLTLMTDRASVQVAQGFQRR
jgi:hypothetical protein